MTQQHELTNETVAEPKAEPEPKADKTETVSELVTASGLVKLTEPMSFNLFIREISVSLSKGQDIVTIKVDLPPMYKNAPEDGAFLTFTCDKNCGVDYVKSNFNVDPIVYSRLA